MAGSNKPNIPYIMSVLADVWSRQYGMEMTITCTPKEGAKKPAENEDTKE